MKLAYTVISVVVIMLEFGQISINAPTPSPTVEITWQGQLFRFYDIDLDGYLDRVIVIGPKGKLRSYSGFNTDPIKWGQLEKLYWKFALSAIKRPALKSPGS